MAVLRFVVIQAGKLSVERWLNQIEKGRRNCYFFLCMQAGMDEAYEIGNLQQEGYKSRTFDSRKNLSYTPPTCSWTRYCEDNTLLGFTKMVHTKSNVLVKEPNL